MAVRNESQPINGMKRLITGSKPIDGGHYIFESAERDAFLLAEPEATKFLRPFVGAREFLRGEQRWTRALRDAQPQELARLLRVLPLFAHSEKPAQANPR